MTLAKHPAGKRKRPLLVAVIGGSGAGKSWLAQKLETQLAPRAVRLALDNFYRDQSHLSPARRDRINFDHPRAIDWKTFETVLTCLAQGRPARVPHYDFATHSRTRNSEIIQPKPVVLVEGLWLLRRPSLRRLFRWSVFVDCPRRLRLARRLARDAAERGRNRASILKQFRATVDPMHARFVVPQKHHAKLALNGTCSEEQIAAVAEQLRSMLLER
jgi:uridine kinase